MGSNPGPQPLPFWQVNVPPQDHEEDCPEYLRNLSIKDIDIISTRDEDYHVQTWEEVVDIVRTHRLHAFQRWPSELRRYREFVWRLDRDHGSVMDYMLKERIHWTQPIVPRSRTPFECDDDLKILCNDWPYGVDKRIIHLVVWTKFVLDDSAETKTEIERFIRRTFLPKVAKDKVSSASSHRKRGILDTDVKSS